MVDMDILKHVLTGGAAFLLLFSVLGEIIYCGEYATRDWTESYRAYLPGRYGAYYQLSVGIVVMGVFALACFLVYLVFVVLGLSILPDMIVNIIGLAGAVFWFGLFIAECCAIDWQGFASATPTRKAVANDKMVKYIIEHPVVGTDFEYIYPDHATTNNAYVMTTTLYEENKDFDKFSDYDKYQSGISLRSQCIKTSDNKEMCLGSWSKSKMQRYHDKTVKKIEQEIKDTAKEMEKELKNPSTEKQRKKREYSELKNEYIYLIGDPSDVSDNVFGIFNAYTTSIFFGGQIVGIVLFACSIALGFIGGFSGGNGSPKKKDNSEEAKDKTEEV